jgi:hypothetical protein
MNTANLPRQADEPLPSFCADAIDVLNAAAIPFLIGGAFAQSRYTKRYRETKDLDIIIRRRDVPETLTAFDAAGYRTEMTFPHWLAKIHSGDFVLDLVYSSGNGVLDVDDDWFTHAVDGEVLGRAVKLCPVEELLWSKAFIQERERYDGNDVLHLLHARASGMDWDRLVARFGDHWPVLLSQIVLFFFVYPDRRGTVPSAVVDDLMGRMRRLRTEPNNPLCLGTLLSRKQYLFDITRLGYVDARVEPHGDMTPEETEVWTRAIERD